MTRRVLRCEDARTSTTLRSKVYVLACVLAVVTAGYVRAFAQSQGADRPELVLQLAHTGIVRAVAFSPDGRWLATGSADYTVKIWDVATGFQIRNLTGFPSEVQTWLSVRTVCGWPLRE
jgi:WD40 repeat protein